MGDSLKVTLLGITHILLGCISFFFFFWGGGGAKLVKYSAWF